MKLNILAFGAHPDDTEISCSGTLLKHIALGMSVGVVDLTRGELGTRGTADTRDREAADAANIIGLSVRHNLRMRDGFFTNNEPHQRLVIEQLRRFKPDMVLATAPSDRHPDHGRAAQLVAEACFLSGLRKVTTQWEGAEQEPWRPRLVLHYIQDNHLTPQIVVDISGQMDKKLEAISAFRSQFFDPNSSEPETAISRSDFFDFLRGRAKEMGRPIGANYAEGFISQRLLGVERLDWLV